MTAWHARSCSGAIQVPNVFSSHGHPVRNTNVHMPRTCSSPSFPSTGDCIKTERISCRPESVAGKSAHEEYNVGLRLGDGLLVGFWTGGRARIPKSKPWHLHDPQPAPERHNPLHRLPAKVSTQVVGGRSNKRGSTLQICCVNVLRDDVRFRDHAARLTRTSIALHVQIPGLPLVRVSDVLISPIVAILDLCKQPISSRKSPDSNMAPSQGLKGQPPILRYAASAVWLF